MHACMHGAGPPCPPCTQHSTARQQAGRRVPARRVGRIGCSAAAVHAATPLPCGGQQHTALWLQVQQRMRACASPAAAMHACMHPCVCVGVRGCSGGAGRPCGAAAREWRRPLLLRRPPQQPGRAAAGPPALPAPLALRCTHAGGKRLPRPGRGGAAYGASALRVPSSVAAAVECRGLSSSDMLACTSGLVPAGHIEPRATCHDPPCHQHVPLHVHHQSTWPVPAV